MLESAFMSTSDKSVILTAYKQTHFVPYPLSLILIEVLFLTMTVFPKILLK